MPKLVDLKIRGVALVDRGANQHAKVLISKRAGGDMTEAELKAAAEKSAKELADAQAALAKAQAELKDLKDAGTITSDVETLKKQHAEAEKALTKERTELQEQVAKAIKETEEARAEVAKIKATRRREEFLKRAHELKGLPGAAADDFGEVLDAIEAGLHQSVPDKATKYFEKLNRLLTSWNVIVGKSAILQEVGRTGIGTFRGALAQLQMLAKEEQGKDPKLTPEQAFTKAMEANPALYRQYQTEKES